MIMKLLRQLWLQFEQWLDQTRRSLQLQPWKDKVTSKIILKVIAHQQNEKKFPASSLKPPPKTAMMQRLYLVASSCRSHIRAWLSLPPVEKSKEMLLAIWRQIQKWLQYPTSLIFFLFLYLLVWHPGLHSRYLPEDHTAQSNIHRSIPARPKIYPLDQVKLEIDCAGGWIAFFYER